MTRFGGFFFAYRKGFDMKPDKKEQKPKTLEQAIATDEYAGKAGSYTFDPETGKRTPTQQQPKDKG